MTTDIPSNNLQTTEPDGLVIGAGFAGSNNCSAYATASACPGGRWRRAVAWAPGTEPLSGARCDPAMFIGTRFLPADARVGMVRTLSRPAGVMRYLNFVADRFDLKRTSISTPGRCCALRRGREPLAGAHRTGPDGGQILDHRRRLPVHGKRAALPGLKVSKGIGTTLANGRMRAWISPASGWA
jgi:hypothetical protein